MITAALPSPRPALTLHQASVRRRTRRLPLKAAVRAAAAAFFRFRYHAVEGKALWSDAERVWMGSQTFLHWSFLDPEIDIPRVVRRPDDVPEHAKQRDAAIRAELLAYWTERVAALPPARRPKWLPLP